MKEFGLIIKLAVIIILIIAFGEWAPEWLQQTFFTLSMMLKDTLVFAMPIIVFALIFSCLAGFQKKAPLLVLMILLIVVCSNFLFVQFGYFVGDFFLPLLGYTSINAVEKASSTVAELQPFFSIPYPHVMGTDTALLIGVAAGLYGAFFGSERLASWGNKLRDIVQAGLTKVFIPLVPLYVAGFLFKIQHDQSLGEMFAGYGPMIALIVAAQTLATIMFYIKANMGKFRDIKNSLGNLLPSGLVAVSTMSSIASMPLLLEGAEANAKNKSVAQIMVPASINIHHVGDSVAVPILIAVVLATTGIEAMDYSTFLLFSMYYMVAKFGVPSVPGGEMVVLCPILATNFGFSPTMIGLIMTLYILMDPFITTANVLCNGALAIFMDKICGRMKAFKDTEEEALETANDLQY